MANRPNFNNIVFKFTNKGYVAPDFNNIHFVFRKIPPNDLKASLQVFDVYKTSTYTYLKSCPTITISYPGAVQIIKLPCIYGGIRDIGGYIYANPFNFDLGAYIFVIERYLDLKAYIRSTIQAYSIVAANVKTIPPFDLYGNIHGFAISNIPAYLSGFDLLDISAVISTHLPTNLYAYLNIIEIRDLPSYIKGEWWHGGLNLKGDIYKIYQRGVKPLRIKLHGYDTIDLFALVVSVYKHDLVAQVQSTSILDLSATVINIEPANLYSYMHGFDIRGLPSYINGKYGPGHLHACIFSILPKNLSAFIHGYKGINIPFDLRAVTQGFYEYLLTAKITGVSGINLPALLFSRGGSISLRARIIPKVVHLKRVLLISLLEHKDLNAVINYSCFASSFSDLSSYLYTIYKKDLKASVFPLRASNEYLDLFAVVNSSLYQVEDKVTIKLVPQPLKYTVDRVVIKPKRSYYICNTIDVLYSSTFYFKNLAAVISGTLRFRDLPASITAVILRNYSELPEYIKPKSHEVVIKFDGKGREKWRRFVELMFRKDGAEPYHYFYVSGENKVYRVDRNRHWTIWAYSYVSDKTDMIERKAVRTKFIFNINKYHSIDEAVRDLIDRVSAYREYNLKAEIYPFLDKIICLKAHINPIGVVKKRWSRYLVAVINKSDFNFTDKGYMAPTNYDFNFKY